MKIALITDTHFGARNDNVNFNEYFYQFYEGVFFPYLQQNNIKCEVDLRNEKISYKVREHSLKKVPLIFAIGKKEMSDNTVSVRRIGSNDNEVLDLDTVIKEIVKENKV